MHSLQELVDVVSKNKVKSVRTLEPDNGNPRDMLHDLYDRLTKNQFPDDASAAAFYGYSSPNDKAYRKQRNKLQQRLIDTAFFIDTSSPKFNDHQKAYYTCQKNLMAVKVLLARYARRTAIDLALNTVKKSDRFEFSEISAELYKLLRNHYASHSYNKSLYANYSDLANHYSSVAQAEDLVFEMYDSTSILMQKLTANKAEIISQWTHYQKTMEPLLIKYQSFRLHLWYYFLQLRMESLRNNYHSIISVCDNAIHFFNQKPFISDQFVGAFYYHKLKSLILLRDYKKAHTMANKCIAIFEENTIRWYTAHEYSLILNLHSMSFGQALIIHDKVITSKAFVQFMDIQERWYIFDAYFYFLSATKKILIPNNSKIGGFRIQKFLNEVPVFSMDKSGYNIPILIIQILIQIQQKKYNQLTDRIEAIEKYTTRHLHKDSNYRSNCFIRMLLQIPKQNFNRTKVEKHTKKLVDKLNAMPLEKANQPFEIEIIPYEHLWELVLESLAQ